MSSLSKFQTLQLTILFTEPFDQPNIWNEQLYLIVPPYTFKNMTACLCQLELQMQIMQEIDTGSFQMLIIEGQCQHDVLESTFTDTKYVLENQNSKTFR
jgi:hypothetical protein